MQTPNQIMIGPNVRETAAKHYIMHSVGQHASAVPYAMDLWNGYVMGKLTTGDIQGVWGTTEQDDEQVVRTSLQSVQCTLTMPTHMYVRMLAKLARMLYCANMPGVLDELYIIPDYMSEDDDNAECSSTKVQPVETM